MEKFFKTKSHSDGRINVLCDKIKKISKEWEHCETNIGYCPVIKMDVSVYMCKNRIDCKICDGKYSVS